MYIHITVNLPHVLLCSYTYIYGRILLSFGPIISHTCSNHPWWHHHHPYIDVDEDRRVEGGSENTSDSMHTHCI